MGERTFVYESEPELICGDGARRMLGMREEPDIIIESADVLGARVVEYRRGVRRVVKVRKEGEDG